jgi:hypothetical protein
VILAAVFSEKSAGQAHARRPPRPAQQEKRTDLYSPIITLADGRHLAVAAFVSDSAANDDTRDAIIARLAKAAWDRAHSLGQ